VNAEFVPVALKAGLVNNPGSDAEGRLYTEIGRSMLAPQGICIVNSSGKVLDWIAMFDDEKSVAGLLDHALAQYRAHPDGSAAVAAERYMKYPSIRLPDVAGSATTSRIPSGHAAGLRCPATPVLPPGTLSGHVYGRALGPDGKLAADATRQERYVEDLFEVPVPQQESLAGLALKAGSGPVRLPDELTRSLIGHAYLGHLDVNPYNPPDGSPSTVRCEIWAQRDPAGPSGTVRLRLAGNSAAKGGMGQRPNPGAPGADGRIWAHEVQLRWQGFIDLRGNRILRLVLWAEGREMLHWENEAFGPGRNTAADVTHLPAGHYVDETCEVRYGLEASGR
jgi:hypothetical protein